MADSTFDFLKNYDTSIAPLKAAYQQQAAQGPTGMFANVDPVMLGLAQGFLSPTRSGGFGESLGLGLAGAQAPLEAIRKRQMTAQEKLAELEATRARMAMEAPYREALAEYYTSGGAKANPADKERLLYTTLLGDANKWEWDDTNPPLNPITKMPFKSEEDMKAFQTEVRSRLYSLSPLGKEAVSAEDKKAKSNYSSDETKKEPAPESAPPVPRDVKAREVGKVYSSPKGLYKWTGEGWEPASLK